MMLLTKEILEKFKKTGSQEHSPDPLVICKFFDPCGSWTWYPYEYDPERREFFGMVHGDEEELGYFSLDELQSIRGPLGLGIERDRGWTPRPLSAIKSRRAVA